LSGVAFDGYSQHHPKPAGNFVSRPQLARIAKPAPNLASAGKRPSSCTNFGHPPVNGLHSIENKSDKLSHFSLTPKI
jgi:hypothetical protein